MAEVNLKNSISLNLFLLKVLWFGSDQIVITNYTRILIVSMFLHNLSQLIYVILNLSNLVEAVATLYSLLGTLSAQLKLLVFSYNIKKVKKVVEFYDQKDFQPKTNIQIKVLNKALSLSNIVFKTFFYLCLIGILLWIFSPILAQERGLPSKAWFPFEHCSTRNYVLVYFWQGLMIAYFSLTNIGLDTLFFISSVQIGAQCELIGDRILGLDFTDKVNWKGCVKHHKMILEWAQDLGNVYKDIALVQFTTALLVLCLTMFMLTITSEFGASFAMLVMYQVCSVVQVFLYCWFGSEATLKSQQLVDAVYNSLWYSAPQIFKKDIVFFIMRVHKPILFYVGNIFPINLITFTSLVRSSWAYFMAMRSLSISK